MTVTSTLAYQRTSGDGTTVDFGVPFGLIQAEQLVVELVDKLTGAVTSLTNGVHYTLTIADDRQSAMVTLALAPPATHWVVRRRQGVFQQPTHLLPHGRFPADMAEIAIDRLAQDIQVLRDKSQRTIRLSDSEAAIDPLPSLMSLAGKYLFIDQFGKPIGVNGPAEAVGAHGVRHRTAFRAMLASPPLVVVGYGTVRGDGWGGVFELDPDDTSSPDDGAMTIVTVANLRYKRQFVGNIRAEWFDMPPLDEGLIPRDAAIIKAVAAAASRKVGVEFPGGKFLIDGSLGSITLHEVSLFGAAVPNRRGNPVNWAFFQGTNFLITSLSVIPFLFRQSIELVGITWFYPNQTGHRPGNEILVYPPLISNPVNLPENRNDCADIKIRNCSVVNAYDVWIQRRVADAVAPEDCTPTNYGNIRFENCDIYGIRSGINFERVSEAAVFDNVIFNTGNFFEGANLGDLLAWTQANGSVLRAIGHGTHAQANAFDFGAGLVNVIFGGLQVVSCTFGAYKNIVEIDGGSLDEAMFNSTCDGTATQTVLHCKTNGTVTRVSFQGKAYAFDAIGSASNRAAFILDNPAQGGPSNASDIKISSFTLGGGNGSFLEANGDYIASIDIVGLTAGNWGGSGTAGSYYIANIACPNAQVNIVGLAAYTGAVGTKANGIRVSASRSTTVVGATIHNANRPIDVTGNTGRICVSGVTTTATQSSNSVYGTAGGNLMFGLNNFDKPNHALDGLYQFGTNGLSMFLAGQSLGGGADPYLGYNLFKNASGSWVFGPGSAGTYGALSRLDAGAGQLGFFMSTAGGAAGATASLAQLLSIDAPGNQVVVQQLASFGPVIANTVLKSGVYTVATLPSASAAGSSARAAVTNANATTLGSVVAGGGANYVPVISDGTNWRIG